jgi:lysophospholipase L1-like esterase
MKKFNPIYTFLFLLAVFAGFRVLSEFFPAEGIVISDKFTLRFPQPGSFFSNGKKEKPDISKFIARADSAEKADSLAKIKLDAILALHKKDSLNKKGKHLSVTVDSGVHKLVTTIQFKEGKKGALDKFFNSLKFFREENRSVRILHYGDSQIEGDRVSDYLRLKLQNQFGGEGPGFISAMPVAQGVAIRQQWSDNFDRYTIFTGKDKRVKHSNFGVMGSFCRFAPYNTATDSSKLLEASIKISTTKSGGPKIAAYSKIKMYYAGASKKTAVEFYEAGELKNSDSLEAAGNFNIKTWNLSAAPGKWELKFKGKDSPDIYGISLEGGTGVMVDNFGLRGSSGTFFNQMSLSHLSQFYNNLNVKLIILQFGGNSLPLIKDSTQAANFGKYLKAQIVSLKKILPDASFLIIGPADMSVKVGTEYETHPFLEPLRDAIRKAAFDTDCAFWDMYDVMGGKNSMVEWVKMEIAATDYIHFSPGGARKVATMLYTALIEEYTNYLNFTTSK